MTIAADPDAIRRFAAAVAESSLHAGAARDYGYRYGDLPPEAVGLMSLYRGKHDSFLAGPAATNRCCGSEPAPSAPARERRVVVSMATMSINAAAKVVIPDGWRGVAVVDHRRSVSEQRAVPAVRAR